MIYAFLADTIVTVHFGYVIFTVGGELLILLGGIFKWRWIKNLTFRIVNLCAVVLVAIEAAGGVLCPLTEWEYRLRTLAGQNVEDRIAFVPRLIRSLIFYDFPWWVFVAMYIGFGAIVVLTFIFIPPARKRKITAPPCRPSGRGGPQTGGCNAGSYDDPYGSPAGSPGRANEEKDGGRA